MTRLIARLILAMLILPVTGAVFVFVFAAMATSGDPGVGGVLVLWMVIYAFVAAYWILLWRSMVRWNERRVMGTVAAAGAALVVGGFAYVMARGMLRGIPTEPALMLAGGTVPITWVIATVLIWRETPAERMERLARTGREAVACPVCGYNLTGLTEARCPECGSSFTLDQLLAGQPDRDGVTLPEE